jgi:hypothetical protein
MVHLGTGELLTEVALEGSHDVFRNERDLSYVGKEDRRRVFHDIE